MMRTSMAAWLERRRPLATRLAGAPPPASGGPVARRVLPVVATPASVPVPVAVPQQAGLIPPRAEASGISARSAPAASAAAAIAPQPVPVHPQTPPATAP